MALLAVRVGGDVVGEMAVVDGGVRSATVTATRAACLAVEVPAAEFIAFVDRHPSAGRLLSAELSRRLRSSDRRRIDFTAYEVPARVARVLTELADDYGRPWLARPPTISLGIGITQAELASLVGAKEASVQQALSELRERKILSWQYRAVELYDMESLRKVAEGIS
jgi:CRP-like cAMP-binding protein